MEKNMETTLVTSIVGSYRENGKGHCSHYIMGTISTMLPSD